MLKEFEHAVKKKVKQLCLTIDGKEKTISNVAHKEVLS